MWAGFFLFPTFSPEKQQIVAVQDLQSPSNGSFRLFSIGFNRGSAGFWGRWPEASGSSLTTDQLPVGHLNTVAQQFSNSSLTLFNPPLYYLTY